MDQRWDVLEKETFVEKENVARVCWSTWKEICLCTEDCSLMRYFLTFPKGFWEMVSPEILKMLLVLEYDCKKSLQGRADSWKVGIKGQECEGLSPVPSYRGFKNMHFSNYAQRLWGRAFSVRRLADILLFRLVKDKWTEKNCERITVLCDSMIKRQMKFNTKVWSNELHLKNAKKT